MIFHSSAYLSAIFCRANNFERGSQKNMQRNNEERFLSSLSRAHKSFYSSSTYNFVVAPEYRKFRFTFLASTLEQLVTSADRGATVHASPSSSPRNTLVNSEPAAAAAITKILKVHERNHSVGREEANTHRFQVRRLSARTGGQREKTSFETRACVNPRAFRLFVREKSPRRVG